MTAEDRRVANAALGVGPWENHDQIVMAVSDRLKLTPKEVEAKLKRLRIRQVLNCIGTARDVNVNPEQQKSSVRYDKGTDWTDED